MKDLKECILSLQARSDYLDEHIVRQQLSETRQSWSSVCKARDIPFMDILSWQNTILQPQILREIHRFDDAEKAYLFMVFFIPGISILALEGSQVSSLKSHFDRIVLRSSVVSISRLLSLPHTPYESRLAIKNIIQCIHDQNKLHLLFSSDEQEIDKASVTSSCEDSYPSCLKMSSILSNLFAIPEKSCKYADLADGLHPRIFWPSFLSNFLQTEIKVDERNFSGLLQKIHMTGNVEYLVSIIIDDTYQIEHHIFEGIWKYLPSTTTVAIFQRAIQSFSIKKGNAQSFSDTLKWITTFSIKLRQVFQNQLCIRKFLGDQYFILDSNPKDDMTLLLISYYLRYFLDENALDDVMNSLTSKWIDRRFAHATSFSCILGVGRFILMNLTKVKNKDSALHSDRMLSNMDIFLSNQNEVIRILSMVLGEEISKLDDSNSVKLKFEFKKESDELVSRFRSLVNDDIFADTYMVSTTPGFEVKEHSIHNSTPRMDSDDEEDDEFSILPSLMNESFTTSRKDNDGHLINTPRFLKECIVVLQETGDYLRREIAIQALPGLLVHATDIELQEMTELIWNRLLQPQSLFDDERYQLLLQECGISLCMRVPDASLSHLSKLLCDQNVHLKDKLQILKWIARSAWKLNNELPIALESSKTDKKKSVTVDNIERTIIGKTTWKSSKLKQSKSSWKNRFSNHAELFFYHLLRCISIRSDDLTKPSSLDQILASEFVRTLSIVVFCSSVCPGILNIMDDFIHFQMDCMKYHPIDNFEKSQLTMLQESIVFSIRVTMHLCLESNLLLDHISHHYVYLTFVSQIIQELISMSGLTENIQVQLQYIIAAYKKIQSNSKILMF